MPTTLGKTTPPGWTSPDHAKEQTDAARRRAQKTQLMRRRRAELTPSNKDLDKTHNTQSKRRRRAELSPEDKEKANAERRVKRRFDKDSPDQAKERTDAARRRALKTQSKRRRRAELTPSNKDLDKTLNTQSKRRKRAELSPEDKDQANEEQRVIRRFDKENLARRAAKPEAITKRKSKEVTTAQGQDRQVTARAAKTRALASIQAVQ